MSLYVSSHYKNSPNDLQLLSDAPAHQLYALLGPVDSESSSTPDILCVIQLCLEGQISKQNVMTQLSRGIRASGDLIPWTISQQFQDADFASLSGARIVRIATHPDLARMGYGSRALELLTKYFSGELADIEEPGESVTEREKQDAGEEEEVANLLNERLKPRKSLPPLLEPVRFSHLSSLKTWSIHQLLVYLPVYLHLHLCPCSCSFVQLNSESQRHQTIWVNWHRHRALCLTA